VAQRTQNFENGEKALDDSPQSFADLLTRIRQGDEYAAATLLERYGDHVRRVVRIRTSDPRFWRQVDSLDLCQSVFANFIVRVRLGHYSIEDDKQLLALLSRMAINKVLRVRRRMYAARRDARRATDDPSGLHEVTDSESSPSAALQFQELLELFMARLTPDERIIAEKRKNGATWESLAAERATSEAALRVGFARSIRRISQELGL